MKGETKKSTRNGVGRKAKMEVEKTSFGTNLRELRKSSGIKQRIIAEATGVSLQTVTSWENGTTEPGSLATICKIADLFKTSLDALVGHVTVSGNVVTVNGGDYNAPVAGRDVNGSIGGNWEARQRLEKECAAKDKLIASQQATIERLSKMLEGLASAMK